MRRARFYFISAYNTQHSHGTNRKPIVEKIVCKIKLFNTKLLNYAAWNKWIYPKCNAYDLLLRKCYWNNNLKSVNLPKNLMDTIALGAIHLNFIRLFSLDFAGYQQWLSLVRTGKLVKHNLYESIKYIWRLIWRHWTYKMLLKENDTRNITLGHPWHARPPHVILMVLQMPSRQIWYHAATMTFISILV